MVPPSHSRISRYHGWVTRRPVAVLVGALFIFVAATGLAMRLKLKTAFSELLPSNDPGVVALARTQKRLGDLSLLLIGIRSPDREANLRYAEALTQKLRALPPTVVDLATYHVRDVRAFFESNKWLYVSEADLESIRDRLRTEISKRKNPLFVSLGGDDEESVEAMRQRMSGKGGLERSFPGGVFESKGEGGDYVWIAALPPGGLFVENAGEALLNAANELIAADPPTRYHPQMKVEPAGPIVTGIASRRAVERDIMSVTITCLIIVALSIGLYFRRWRAIPLTGAPAAMGTVMAFAVAELAFGYLNSSTAFLGSIIIGNGINYAIVLMSRYEEHRARGDDPEEALRCALGGTWRGTLVASIAASAAYASLTVTSFRGFSQFGVMGATGALFCWLATYSIVPAMLTLLDRRERATGLRRPHAPLEFGPLARFLQRHAARSPRGSRCSTVVSLVGLRHFLEGPVRIRLPQAQREAGDDRGREAVQQEPQRHVRPLAVADHPARRFGRRGRADEGRDPAPGQGARQGQGRPDRDDLRSAARAARGAAAQARGARPDSQADPRPGAGRAERQREGGPGQDRPFARAARADAHGPAADRPAPVHRGRRLGRQGGAGLPARARASRSGTGAICCASPRCCRRSSSTTAR